MYKLHSYGLCDIKECPKCKNGYKKQAMIGQTLCLSWYDVLLSKNGMDFNIDIQSQLNFTNIRWISYAIMYYFISV